MIMIPIIRILHQALIHLPFGQIFPDRPSPFTLTEFIAERSQDIIQAAPAVKHRAASRSIFLHLAAIRLLQATGTTIGMLPVMFRIAAPQ